MADGDTLKKKSGRPRLYPGTEKRPTLTFRVRDRMHEQLSSAAAEGGRSLSEEIERRLDQSFSIHEIIKAASDSAAEAAVKNQQLNQFGSRLVFESSWLYAQILQGLIERLKKKSDLNPDWFMPVEETRDYLKTELAARIDGMMEVFYFDIALMDLEGPEKYEADAFKRERSIPKEIAGTYLNYQMRKNAIRHKLLPHIMDRMGEEETD